MQQQQWQQWQQEEVEKQCVYTARCDAVYMYRSA